MEWNDANDRQIIKNQNLNKKGKKGKDKGAKLTTFRNIISRDDLVSLSLLLFSEEVKGRERGEIHRLFLLSDDARDCKCEKRRI